ncbi:MAG TPA: beta-N-acetylhexosaminidase [Azospirillaceae bacterium]|nr:beta-N-acetylhexosaminidase [Azospirillaceae bacterium]
MSGTDATAVVYGCAGTDLTAEERAFFRDADPFGFILFRRNCDSAEQVRRLVAEMRDSVDRAAPVLIDQEGGRVARLRPPHWPALPAAGLLAPGGTRAAWLHGRLLAAMLEPLGIDVDCAPVADVPVPGAHDVIGDRAFAGEPRLVAELARAQAEGLMAGGVLPVVKHIPGHGRAHVDSHKELPVVPTPRAELEATDFAPFRALADLPMAMVAHVVYTAVDSLSPSSTSARVIGEVVRGHIGFDGLLFSDDLGMEALKGGPAERALAVLAAGCDVALHCNGEMDQMKAIAAVAPRLTTEAAARWERARGFVKAAEPVDAAALKLELDMLLGTGIA